MENWYNRTDLEIESHLFNAWNLKKLLIIGRYQQVVDEDFCFFNDCRSLDFEPLDYIELFEGSRRSKEVLIFGTHQEIWKTGEYYQIEAELASLKERKDERNPFLLRIKANTPVEPLTPEIFIRQRYQLYADAPTKLTKQIAKTIKTITAEINKKPETFIYELLQNADDFPTSTKKVHVNIELTGQYLVMTHDGQPFNYKNVDALCGINEGNKRDKQDTIGFKGIGFKSVFNDCDYVLINSGGFVFRFDKTYFRSKEKPWQLIPIWNLKEETDISILKNTYFSQLPVSFALKPKNETILFTDFDNKPSYKNSLLSVFSDERILLFLRHVEQVIIRFENQEYICEKQSSNWWKYSFVFEVDDEQRDYLNKEIEGENDKIPEKFKSIEKSEISFAIRRKGMSILPIEDGVLFAYLPTRVSLGLPFLINADFIPDGSRDGLHELQWNTYLLKVAGQKFPQWLREIGLNSWMDKDGIRQKFSTTFLRLIPDFVESNSFPKLVNAFKEGFDTSITKVAFIPDKSGNLYSLASILIDDTGLAVLIGDELFREFCSEERVIIRVDRISTRKLTHLIKEHNVGRVLERNDLLNLIDTASFQNWLEVPAQNIGFLKLLISKKWLDDFKDKSIFLNQDGKLCPADELWFDLGDDLLLLSWLNPAYLHPEVRQEIGELSEVINVYSVERFVKTIILGDKNKVDALLDQKSNNLNFYRYLFKHRALLSDDYFGKGKLSWFKVWGNSEGEEYISSFEISSSLYIHDVVLADLIDKNIFPTDHFCLLSPEFAENPEDQPAWNKFWMEKFEVKPYGTVTFLDDEILVAIDAINKHYKEYEGFNNNPSDSYCQRRESSMHLWEYIGEILPKLGTDKQAEAHQYLKELVVFTTRNGTPIPLQNCFLSKEYTGNNTIEQLAEEHNLELDFVADFYQSSTSLSKEKWHKLFKDCHVRDDEKEVIEQNLIPILDDFPEENLLDAMRLLFKHRSHLDKWLEKLSDLKVKTVDGQWINLKLAVLGHHYTQTDWINAVLPTVEPSNIISEEYTNGKNIDKWSSFFQKLGVQSLSAEADVISYKIDYLLVNQSILNTPKTTVAIIGELLTLHKGDKLMESNYDKLHELNLLVNGGMQPARQCHLSSAYKPHLDLEQLLPENERPVIFVNPSYQKTEGKLLELKSFLKKIGVEDEFRSLSQSNVHRAKLNANYLLSIESLHSHIPKDAVKWSGNHFIESLIEINYQPYLTIYAVSRKFWEQIADSKPLSSVFKLTIYKCGGIRFPIVNYATFQLQRDKVIPTLAGTCANAQSLFSYKFKNLVNDPSLIPAVDLTTTFVEGKTTEEWIGIQQKLAIRYYLRRVKQVQDYEQLKQEGIWDEITDTLSTKPLKLDSTDEVAHQEFIASGTLPNQLGVWQPINLLHYISDGFDIGLGRYEGLIHNDLLKLAALFSVKKLTKDDFKFSTKALEKDILFKNHLISRIKYIAFAENQSIWRELIKDYQLKLSGITFWRTRQIAFSFGDGETAIHSTEENFWKDEEGLNVYYLGNWNGPHAVDLFDFLIKALELNISKKQLIDLLINEVYQIIIFFEERDITVPADWKPSPDLPKNTITSTPPEVKPALSEVEQNRSGSTFTEPIDQTTRRLAISKGISADEQKAKNKEAKDVVLDWIQKSSKYEYDSQIANPDQYDRIEGIRRKADEEIYTFLVSSVQHGELYIWPIKWLELGEPKTILALVSNGVVGLLETQEEVLERYTRTVFRVSNSRITVDELESIAEQNKYVNTLQFVFYDSVAAYDASFAVSLPTSNKKDLDIDDSQEDNLDK